MAGVVVGAFLLLSGPAVSAQSTDLNCDDFPSRATAQATLDADTSDPNDLDGNDDDGLACESFDYQGDEGGSVPAPDPDPVSPSGTDAPDVTTGASGVMPEATTATSGGAMPAGSVAAGFGGTAEDDADEGGGDSAQAVPWPTFVYGAGMLLTALGVARWWRSRRG